MKRSMCCLTVLVVAVPVSAQSPRFHYPEPPASDYAVSRDVRYGTADTAALRMDVYRPAHADAPRPALVFFTIGTQRASVGYTSWARVAASKGLVAVLADLRMPPAAADDFRTLLAHLSARGVEYGVDTAAIAVFGASGNGVNVFPIVQDPRETHVKAVVMYYSGAQVTQLRGDLPVLYVRAGLDRPFVNASIDTLIARALTQNVPITVINYPGGHHGFEIIDDVGPTREIIDQTVEFVKRATTPAHRAALQGTLGHATAAAHVLAGNFAAAAALYADLVARQPNDARLRLSYGEALLGARRYGQACAEFSRLKGRGLGPRDLGLPAARACMQNGDPEAAMAWLASIPKRFIPPSVKEELVFARLAGRADFVALFEP